MTFVEYYNEMNKFHNHQFLLAHEIENAPADVRADLADHLAKDDGTIGIYVYHSHEINSVTGKVEFVGMQMGYYVRSWEWMYNSPIKDWFWKHRAVNGN